MGRPATDPQIAIEDDAANARVSRLVERFRLENGWSVKRMAIELSMSDPSSYTTKRNGKFKWSFRDLRNMHALGVPADELLRGGV